MVAENEQPSVIGEESEQYKAFKERVDNNLHVPHWPDEVMQYFIERPQLIPRALETGLDTLLVKDEARARRVLEKFIWRFPLDDDLIKKLVIWFTRQSKGLVEDIILHTPYDPDDQREGIHDLCTAACRFIDYMNS